MLTRLNWLLVMSFLKVNADQREENPIIVKMDPDQVVETFKSVLTSPYFKDMANQIATKAVEHYISQVSKKESMATNIKVGARQRPKYSNQHVQKQSEQQQQLQLQKQQQQKQQQQQQNQQQGLEKQFHEIYQVDIEQDMKKNKPAMNSLSIPVTQYLPIPDTEPQSHLFDSEPQGQTTDENKANEEPNKSILSEQVAYALLKEPSPDGDLGLGLDSLEQPTSPKAQSPPKKINGMYFRRRRIHGNS